MATAQTLELKYTGNLLDHQSALRQDGSPYVDLKHIDQPHGFPTIRSRNGATVSLVANSTCLAYVDLHTRLSPHATVRRGISEGHLNGEPVWLSVSEDGQRVFAINYREREQIVASTPTIDGKRLRLASNYVVVSLDQIYGFVTHNGRTKGCCLTEERGCPVWDLPIVATPLRPGGRITASMVLRDARHWQFVYNLATREISKQLSSTGFPVDFIPGDEELAISSGENLIKADGTVIRPLSNWTTPLFLDETYLAHGNGMVQTLDGGLVARLAVEGVDLADNDDQPIFFGTKKKMGGQLEIIAVQPKARKVYKAPWDP